MSTQFIFDLDGTVIDSSHRQLHENGRLNLDHWRANCTAEKIAQDKLLPLAFQWHRLNQRGAFIIVCTSRVMSEHDYQFLYDNHLHADIIYSRPHGVELSSPDLKEQLLRAHRETWDKHVMFDDEQPVIQHMNKIGIACKDAVRVNKILGQV